MFRRRLSIIPTPQPQTKEDIEKSLAFDFNAADDDSKDDSGNLWEYYKKVCYSQNPPIPALSLMKPILNGEETEAIFPHQQISTHLPIVLQLLTKMKVISILDLTDNSLRPECAKPLIEFVRDDEQLSSLNLANNPMIGPKAMIDLLEGIKESQSLESLTISNTGCTKHVGSSIAHVVDGCKLLIKLDISACDLKQSALEIAQTLPSSPKLKQLNMAKNGLYIGGRRFALQLGANVGKCENLKRLDLSSNAITSEQVAALMRGLANAPKLNYLDLSKNCIDETGGRPIAIFLGKTSTLKFLDISQNQLLNVTINKIRGQQKLEEEQKKPGGRDKKKSSVYTPGCYWIINYLVKNAGLPQKPIKIRMIGLVVEEYEWQQKLEVLKNANPNVEVEYKAPANTFYQFRKPPPPPATSRATGKKSAMSARSARK